MIINAEQTRTQEDLDNNLWLVDFRDEDKGIRGRIEIPSEIANMENVKDFEIEILARSKLKKEPDFKDVRIAFNGFNFRMKPVGKEKAYTLSAGGLILRLFASKKIAEFKLALKEFVVLVR